MSSTSSPSVPSSVLTLDDALQETGIQVTLAILQVSAVVLLSFLSITTIICRLTRHPVIVALIYATIFRSAAALMPAFVYNQLVKELSPRALAQNPTQNTPLTRFCAAQGTAFYFFLAVKSAFAVSFTVAMLSIAKKSTIRQRIEDFGDNLPRQKSPLLDNILALSPFVWGLPLVIIPIPALVHNAGQKPIAVFAQGSCQLLNRQFSKVALYLTILPLGVAMILCAAVIFYAVKFYARHRRLLNSGAVDQALMLRFGAMVLIIFVSAILLIAMAALDFPRRLVIAGQIWEGITWLGIFFIFATQQDILHIWNVWLHKAIGRPAPKRPTTLDPKPPSDPFLSFAPEVDESHSSRCFPWGRCEVLKPSASALQSISSAASPSSTTPAVILLGPPSATPTSRPSMASGEDSSKSRESSELPRDMLPESRRVISARTAPPRAQLPSRPGTAPTPPTGRQEIVVRGARRLSMTLERTDGEERSIPLVEITKPRLERRYDPGIS